MSKEEEFGRQPQPTEAEKDATRLGPRTLTSPSFRLSVTKIVTAWLALEVLGSDYRFETSFYLDDKRVLYVRGGGDPFLTSAS